MTLIARGRQINKAHPLAQGLVGYWPLNEMSGTKAYDLSGNNNHLTVSGAALTGQTSNWVGSPLGGGFNFDGVDDFIGTNTLKDWGFQKFTISSWLIFYSQIGTGISRFITLGASSAFLGFNTSGNIAFNIYNGANWPYENTGGVNYINNRIFVTLTYNGITGIVYVNGKQILSGSPGGGIDWASTARIRINQTSSLTPASSQWEVRYYNRVLQPQEIQTLYNNPHIDLIQTKPYFKNK
jgi:hypothetical protein